MDTLNFIVWKWHDPDYDVSYEAHHVNTLASMLARHVHQPYRLICITDDPEGIECETFPLWTDLSHMKNKGWEHLPNVQNKVFPSCYRRLKIFSPEVTRSLGIEDGERVVSIDLDVVITDTLDPLFDREENFVGWYGNSTNELYGFNGFNGSLFMFRAGTCEFLWTQFDPQESPKLAKEAGFYGSDQGWLSYKMYANSPQWNASDGVLRYFPDLVIPFPNEPVVLVSPLPGTRIAVFCGAHKPWDEISLMQSPWITEYYR